MMKLQKKGTREPFARDGTALPVIIGNLQSYGNDLWRKHNDQIPRHSHRRQDH